LILLYFVILTATVIDVGPRIAAASAARGTTRAANPLLAGYGPAVSDLHRLAPGARSAGFEKIDGRWLLVPA
jgi:hypothetical protein